MWMWLCVCCIQQMYVGIIFVLFLQNRMNRTLLIADYDEARTYMFNRCPKDYGVAFTRDGHRAHSDYRCYTEKRQKRVIYLQSSSDDSLR